MEDRVRPAWAACFRFMRHPCTPYARALPLQPLILRAGLLLLLLAPAGLRAQNNGGSNRLSLLIPDGARMPIPNREMEIHRAVRQRQNFDAANAFRQRQISDEAAKLLILANDLKRQMGQIGDQPLTPRMIREAEVIELLAHDVEKMATLTVKVD